MPKRKERPKRVYEIVDIHPVYATDDDREQAMQQAAVEFYEICKQHGMLKSSKKDETAV